MGDAEDVSLLARNLLGTENPALAVADAIKAATEDKRQRFAAELYDQLIAQNCALPNVYVNRLAQLEAFFERGIPIDQRVSLQRQIAFVLERALANLGDEIAAKRQFHYRLAKTFLDLNKHDNAVRIARRLFDRLEDERFSREIVRVISLLPEAQSSKDLLALAEQLFKTAQTSPEVALLYFRQLRANNASRQAQFEILQGALQHNPNNVGILNSLARCALGRTRAPELEARAEIYARRLSELAPTRESFSIYGRILLLRQKRSEAIAVFEKITHRFECSSLGALSEPLEELCALFDKNFYYEPKTDIDALRQTLTRSQKRLEDYLSASDTITADDLELVARRLSGLNNFFHKFVRLVEVSDDLGEQLGTLDPAPFAAIGLALNECILTILEHALSERVLLRPIKKGEVIRRLLSLYVPLTLAIGQPGRARVRLEALFSAGLAESVTDFLQLARAFDEFEAGNQFALEVRTDSANKIIDIHRMAYWNEWVTAQALPRQIMETATEKEGHFSLVSADGRIVDEKYIQPPFNLERVAAGTVTLRDSELLIGSKGLLLRPNAIHGIFPVAALPSFVTSTLDSVCLRRKDTPVRIDDPVIIPANNSVARSPSYGHWLIFLLTRLNAVAESGLLATRKLLLPAEITSWMKETLALIGIPEEKLILYPKDRDVIAVDAEIISPVDASTGDLIPRLRSRMHMGAGVSGESSREGNAHYLYLARKTQLRRRILDEEEVYRVAEKLGYLIISPETLTVAEQVRLFSQAKAIAGPGGSAFANMIFCKSGTRALCVKGEERVSPLGLDLVVANGISFRWLLGKSLQPLAQFTNPLDVPFDVDMNALERNLAWATEAALESD